MLPGSRISSDTVVNFSAVLIFPFCIITLEAVLFHLLMIVSNYLHATTIISIAMFGIALGGLLSFYLLRFNRRCVLFVSALLFFISIGSSYYGIVRLDNFHFPYLLILPFFSGSIIVSSIFSRADSHKVYFIDLAASALGVLYPIFFVPLIKSENTLMLLSVLPVLFIVILTISIKNIRLRRAGLAASGFLIGAILIFILINTSIPRKISADKYHSVILQSVTIPLEQKILNDVYSRSVDGKHYLLNAPDVYRENMARYIVNKTGYYPFVLDLSVNFRPNLSSEKSYKIYTDKLPDYTFLFSRDNLMGRVEYITKTDKDFLYINNGAFFDRVIYGDRGMTWDIRFPNYLDNASVFIMGASADGIVNSLKKLPGRTSISGVEFNPIIHETMMSGYFFEKSSRAYENTTIHRTEGRAYLRSTDEKFDMITHMNNHSEHGAVCTLAPEYLHTVEGVKEMLSKLTDRGLLVYEEIQWSIRSEWALLKFINTIVAALRESGVDNPADHIVVYRWDYWNWKQPGVTSVVIKRVPFSAEETEKMKSYLEYFMTDEQYHIIQGWKAVLAFPGMKPRGDVGKIISGTMERNPLQLPDYLWYDDFNDKLLARIDNPADADFVRSLYTFNSREDNKSKIDFVSTVFNYNSRRYVLKNGISPEDEERYESILKDTDLSCRMNICPVRDDMPFTYNVYKEKKEVIAILRVVFLLSLIIFIPVTILFIIRYSSHGLTLLRHSSFFVLTGFAFMLVEIVLMQFMQQFIGIPVYSVIITLGAMLFFSGIGSLICSSWNRKWIITAVACIPVFILVYYAALHHVFRFFETSRFSVRMFAGAGLMVPLSLLMGMPFPGAMERIKRDISAEYATLMYSVSGAAGTIGATAAIFFNVTFGFSFTFIVAMMAYALAALLLVGILKD